MDSVTVFGLGLIVGGLGLLATAVVGLGHRYVIFDGRLFGRRRGRRPARPRASGPVRPPRPQQPPLSDRARPADRPLPADRAHSGDRALAADRTLSPDRAQSHDRNLPPRAGRNARTAPGRPRQANQPRRPIPPIAASALLANTVLLQPVPAWSEPAPDRKVEPSPPPEA